MCRIPQRSLSRTQLTVSYPGNNALYARAMLYCARGQSCAAPRQKCYPLPTKNIVWYHVSNIVKNVEFYAKKMSNILWTLHCTSLTVWCCIQRTNLFSNRLTMCSNRDHCLAPPQVHEQVWNLKTFLEKAITRPPEQRWDQYGIVFVKYDS